jgi:hypothetical protein
VKLNVGFDCDFSVGRDAIRELTGFFFAADNTLTVYEFRQFGKTLVSDFLRTGYTKVTVVTCWLIIAVFAEMLLHLLLFSFISIQHCDA